MSLAAERLREAGVYTPQKTILKGGESSEFYVDVKKIFGNPELLGYVAAKIVDTLDVQTDCIAASGYGGLPLGAIVSHDSGIPFTIVRDTQKNHGLNKRIDAYVPQGNDKITIVDDVFTVGTSLRTTATVLGEETQAEILGATVVVNRGDASKSPVPLNWLVDIADLAR